MPGYKSCNEDVNVLGSRFKDSKNFIVAGVLL